MGRPHRDGEGGVTRVVDRAGNPYFRDSLSGLDGSVAGVSCSYNNNNPASDEAVDFNTKRALTTGKHLGVKLVTQTEIHQLALWRNTAKRGGIGDAARFQADLPIVAARIRFKDVLKDHKIFPRLKSVIETTRNDPRDVGAVTKSIGQCRVCFR